MKSPFLHLCVWLATVSFAHAAPGPWTHHAYEGEDATSGHDYFYAEANGKVERVRWIWNGGAQNDPTVTDFLITADRVTIREWVGTRSSLPKLLAGGDEGLVLKEEFHVETGGKSLTDLLKDDSGLPEERRIDLENLASILDLDREPVP